MPCLYPYYMSDRSGRQEESENYLHFLHHDTGTNRPREAGETECHGNRAGSPGRERARECFS